MMVWCNAVSRERERVNNAIDLGVTHIQLSDCLKSSIYRVNTLTTRGTCCSPNPNKCPPSATHSHYTPPHAHHCVRAISPLQILPRIACYCIIIREKHNNCFFFSEIEWLPRWCVESYMNDSSYGYRFNLMFTILSQLFCSFSPVIKFVKVHELSPK
jgi:hypothetical protein